MKKIRFDTAKEMCDSCCRHGFLCEGRSDANFAKFCVGYINSDGYEFYSFTDDDMLIEKPKKELPEWFTECCKKYREEHCKDDPKEESVRKRILEGAIHNVCGDRDIQYGSPENSFSEIAELWSWWLDIDISAKDVGIMMALFKLARIKTGYDKEDSYVDCAGYVACAADCGDICKMSSAEIEQKVKRQDA